jgi:hypothetical protein
MGLFDFFRNEPKDLSMNFPSFKFELPEPNSIKNEITSNLEGKWKGMVLQDVYNYEIRKILPYDYSIDYAEKFEQAGWDGIGTEHGSAPVENLRSWQVFDNKIIRSWKEMVALETTITIEKISDGRYLYRDLDVYNKFNIKSYNWYYEKNHSFLKKFMDNGQSMQEQMNGNYTGMKVHSEGEIILSEKDSYFVPLNYDYLNTFLEEKPLDPTGNNTMRLTEDKEPFGIRQTSNNKFDFHKATFENRVTKQAGIMRTVLKRLVSQYRAEFLRIHEKATTQINIEGDYIDDRDTIVKDSIVNRSNIGPGTSKSKQIREAKALLDDGIIDDDEFKQMKKEILEK